MAEPTPGLRNGPCSDSDPPVVAVVGGGMSGLAAARLLAGLGAVSEAGGKPRPPVVATRANRVVLLEASDRLGGKVATGEIAGVPVELGPDQFLRRNPSAERLARQLGLGDELGPPARQGAAVYSYGQLRPLPAGLVLGVPTDLYALATSGIVSAAGAERARALSGTAVLAPSAFEVGLEDAPAGAGPERSAGSILRDRFGDEVVDRLIDPLLGGINAGTLDELSLGVVAPQVAHLVSGSADSQISPGGGQASKGQAGGAAFFGIRGGLGRLAAAVARELEAAGVELRTSAVVTALGRREGARAGFTLELGTGDRLDCDGVVLAVPGYVASLLLATLSPEAAAVLAAVPYSSVAVLVLAYPAERLATPRRGTGLLVPRVEGTLMTAATWLSDKWPWMAGDRLRLVRVSAGRFGDERIEAADDDELACQLMGELAHVAGIDIEPEEWALVRWPLSFPQYRPGHRGLMGRLEAALDQLPGVAVAGAVLGGIGIPACISSGEEAARTVLLAAGGRGQAG